jgi:hypothetical protein
VTKISAVVPDRASHLRIEERELEAGRAELDRHRIRDMRDPETK